MEDVVHISLKVALNKPKVKVDEELVKKRCVASVSSLYPTHFRCILGCGYITMLFLSCHCIQEQGAGEDQLG
jgi:hypothetical protein